MNIEVRGRLNRPLFFYDFSSGLLQLRSMIGVIYEHCVVFRNALKVFIPNLSHDEPACHIGCADLRMVCLHYTYEDG